MNNWEYAVYLFTGVLSIAVGVGVYTWLLILQRQRDRAFNEAAQALDQQYRASVEQFNTQVQSFSWRPHGDSNPGCIRERDES